MTESPVEELDRVGWRILQALEADARLSFARLARRVGLSPPAVAERVRRMEELGLITAYRAVPDRARLGRPILAFMRVTTPGETFPRLIALARRLDTVVECHHVTGDDCFVVKLAVASVGELEETIARFRRLGQTTTAVVLSTSVAGKPVRPARQPPPVR